MRGWLVLSLLLVLAVPAIALGPVVPAGPQRPPPTGQNPVPSTGSMLLTPNEFAYPTMPWSGGTRPEVYGSVVGYRPVPAQLVTVELPAPSAETQPFRLEPQVVAIPGYVVTETTNGYYYPQRWTVEQLNVGVYQWRLLPAEFVRK